MYTFIKHQEHADVTHQTMFWLPGTDKSHQSHLAVLSCCSWSKSGAVTAGQRKRDGWTVTQRKSEPLRRLQTQRSPGSRLGRRLHPSAPLPQIPRLRWGLRLSRQRSGKWPVRVPDVGFKYSLCPLGVKKKSWRNENNLPWMAGTMKGLGKWIMKNIELRRRFIFFCGVWQDARGWPGKWPSLVD